MNLRKLRKAVSGLIAVLVMFSPCRRESDSLPEADLRQEICSRMGYRYTKEGNTETLDTGRLIASSSVDASGKVTHNVIRKKEADGRIKGLRSPDSGEIESEVTRMDDDHIQSIVTDSERIEFTYDGKGNLTSAALNGVGLLQIEEEENCRRVTYPDGESFRCERIGDRATVLGTGSQAELFLDPESGLPVHVRDEKKGLTTNYAFDEKGEISSAECSFGQFSRNEIGYSADFFGSATTASFDDGYVVFDADGKQSRVDTVRESYVERKKINGKLLSQVNDSEMESGIRSYVSSIRGQRKYVYSAENKLVSTGSESYGYDSLGRLQEEVTSVGRTDYRYDQMGNVTEVSGKESHRLGYRNPLDHSQLTDYDGETLYYDACGNLRTFGEQSFSWKGNRLVNYRKGALSVEYTYSPEGTWSSVTSSRGEKTDYFFSEGRLLASCSRLQGTTVYLYNDAGKLTGLTYGGESYFYVHDPAGNIEGLLDSSGSPALVYSYSAWGIPKIEYCRSQGLARANQYLFKDYLYDWESGLYYLLTRYYSPVLMRFLSRDDLERIATHGLNDPCYNLYAYALNDPISLKDEDGRMAVAIFGTTVVIAGFCLMVILFSLFLALVSIAEQNAPTQVRNSGLIDHSRWDYYDLINRIKDTVSIGMIGFTIAAVCTWVKRNRKPEIHHIIAQHAMRALPARIIWTGERYCCQDIESNLNKIQLKYEFHRHLHTNSYYAIVNLLVKEGWDIMKLEGVIEQLKMIRGALLSFNDNLPF